MKRVHKIFIALGLGVLLLVTSATVFVVRDRATCTGSGSCAACKNCKYCKHCARNGGSCGVCSLYLC